MSLTLNGCSQPQTQKMAQLGLFYMIKLNIHLIPTNLGNLLTMKKGGKMITTSKSKTCATPHQAFKFEVSLLPCIFKVNLLLLFAKLQLTFNRKLSWQSCYSHNIIFFLGGFNKECS